MASELLDAAGPLKRLIADKAYDTNRLRGLLKDPRIKVVIASSARRKLPIPHSREIYQQRNLIERMFARLKDFRRVATRYDKLAWNFGGYDHLVDLQYLSPDPRPAISRFRMAMCLHSSRAMPWRHPGVPNRSSRIALTNSFLRD